MEKLIFTITSKSKQPYSKTLGYIYKVYSKNSNLTIFYELELRNWDLEPKVGMKFEYNVNYKTNTVVVKVVK